MRICLIKTSSMGDILHSLPALTDAQMAIKDLQVDWVVEENFCEIPSWHSAVKQVIPIGLRRWRKQLFNAEHWQQWRAYKQQLQQQNYDAVIDAQGLLKSVLFATYWAKGRKYGYDRHSIREPLASLFYDHTYAINYQQHAVERIRQLFAASLGYPLPTTKGDYGILSHFGSQNPSTEPYIVAIHATTRANKHWLESSWAALFQQLNQRGIKIKLPWGTPQEKARAERLAQQAPLVEVLPKTSLSQLAQIIAQARAVVSVDTGLAHLTAALAVPNISLYGATDPRLIGCYGQQQYYLQGNTMADIQVSQVITKLEQLALFA
ncbi:lipopolysaccharide heptosyltransferase RfaC [Volucribacter amazonae]|uniref:Lipopolysaccharide heptosyltransferase 1 n=1 Tax=Volucribacter amazonae TaxID=256731 RepID=A0A9X4PN49_9PAST|nr:lipopolysaccharide heptosyltransferase RfaC [Volucribacter amazonae]MDG6894788.1 lipopolysaccharide heptosyltransferase 1 [Volucribacter amazonae]